MLTESILLSPLVVPPAYEAVVERVRRAIALGVVLPGEKLPAERVLAERLGVSRVTVREALRVLQGEGLVETGRGSAGSVVADVGGRRVHGREYLKQVDDAFEFRLAVEGAGARLAAQRRDDDAALQRLHLSQQMLNASDDVHEFRRADNDFHLTVASMSGNATIYKAVEDARADAFAWLDLRGFEMVHESSVRGHAAVIDAITKRDGAAAETAMHKHISQAHGEVVAILGE